MLRKLGYGLCFGAVMAGCCGASTMEEASAVMGKVGGSKWPSMALDGTPDHPEPPELANYHATRENLGYYCFMPKNSAEVHLLYEQYKVGDFSNSVLPKGKACWANVLMDIDGELEVRLRIGKMDLINKYLEYVENFVEIVANHFDHDFVGPDLFGNFGVPFHLMENGVWYAYVMASNRQYNSHLTEMDALLIARRLNKLLNKTTCCPQDFLLDAYLLKKG
jgi:hypothetical protein